MHSVDPRNGILDNDTDGDLKVRMRFNKAIDLFPENESLFTVTDSEGALVSARVEIENNDALIYIDDESQLEVGERVYVIAEKGLVASKPILQDGRQINLELYRLLSTQVVELIYRASRPDTISIDAVVPRRIQAATTSEITISTLGIPNDADRVRVYVGSLELSIIDIQQNTAEDERIGIIIASVPPINAAGQYDVRLQVEKDGVWENATLRAGVQVDAALRLDSLTPLWGPLSGGTTVTLYGEGFEPGNTVQEGITLEIGSQPVQDVRVLSSRKIELVTPRGVSGRNNVYARDRYGNESELIGDRGFGFGIKQLSNVRASSINPIDVIVDQETGVAAVATGYFHQTRIDHSDGLNESFFAATFDVQNPTAPLLVGGLPTLPSDFAGLQELDKYRRFSELSSKQTAASLLIDVPELTPEERTELESLKGVGGNLPFSVDSQRLAFREEYEDGIKRKRLYVAAGLGGVARLNFDEQNGLQLTSREEQGGIVRDIAHVGFTSYISNASGVEAKIPDECTAAIGKAQGSGFGSLSFIEPNDPVRMNSNLNVGGGSMLHYHDGWLFKGGSANGALWGPCPPSYEPETAAAPSGSGADTLSTVNIFDPLLNNTYPLDGTIYDVANYGDYILVALGSKGVEIVHRDRPEQRTRFDFEGLQPSGPSAERLKLAGNLLFLSAGGGGVIVLDISTPLEPKVVSAGNSESIVALDLYRDRIIAGADTQGLRTMQVPAAFVLNTNIEHQALIAENENLTLTFNEAVTVESIQANGTVTVIREDTNANVNITISPVNVTDSSARIYEIEFNRQPGVSYRVFVDNCLLYTSPSPRDLSTSRMPSSA